MREQITPFGEFNQNRKPFKVYETIRLGGDDRYIKITDKQLGNENKYISS